VKTFLVITRGDPLDPVPIGVCREPDIVLAAIRAAWREWLELGGERAADPVLCEGIEAFKRRLAVAAAELSRNG